MRRNGRDRTPSWGRQIEMLAHRVEQGGPCRNRELSWDVVDDQRYRNSICAPLAGFFGDGGSLIAHGMSP
jgi:hypothetical protein